MPQNTGLLRSIRSLPPLLVIVLAAGCSSQPWQESLAQANPRRTLQRAHGSIGHNTPYQLGKGGFDPTASTPRRCDCSGFIAWTIGVPRELPPNSGRWLQSDTFWAGGPPVGKGLFTAVSPYSAQPGDLIVYPDGTWGEGHIGLVSAVNQGRITRVIHCSSGNWKKYGDAILETPPTPWQNPAKNPRLVRVNYAQLRQQFGVAESGKWWWFW